MIITLLCTNSGISLAQDVVFSQHSSSVLCLNPSFAGHAEGGRIAINYRNQFPSLGKAFTTYCASYDQKLPDLKSGFGVQAMTDSQCNGIFKRTSVNLFYSYKVTLSREQQLDFGVKVGYYKECLDYQSLVFADQLDAESCSISSNISNEIIPNNLTPSAADFAVGILWSHSNSIYAGFSIDHLSSPKMSYYSGDDNNILKPKVTANAGFCYNVTRSRFDEANTEYFAVRPAIVYQQQGDQKQITLGTDASLSNIHVGCWLKQVFPIRSILVLQTAIEYAGMTIGYSYDATISSHYGQNWGGAHEMSITYEFGSVRKNKNNQTIKTPCF